MVVVNTLYARVLFAAHLEDLEDGKGETARRFSQHSNTNSNGSAEHSMDPSNGTEIVGPKARPGCLASCREMWVRSVSNGTDLTLPGSAKGVAGMKRSLSNDTGALSTE